MPEKPLRVKLAVYMLYLSLGVSATRILATWLCFRASTPTGSLFATFVMSAIGTLFHNEGSLVPYGDIVILPIAAWLYFKIAEGRDWARTTVLIFVLLETLISILSVVIVARAPEFDQTATSFSGRLIHDVSLISELALRISAITLLFGRASSNWFKAMKSRVGETSAGIAL